jgi:hypothetical protein
MTMYKGDTQHVPADKDDFGRSLQVALSFLFEIYGVNLKSHTSPIQKVAPPIFGPC